MTGREPRHNLFDGVTFGKQYGTPLYALSFIFYAAQDTNFLSSYMCQRSEAMLYIFV